MIDDNNIYNPYMNINYTNKIELIKNMINLLLQNFNFDYINEGKDQTKAKDNLQFIFTSTANQKMNEDINNITMNLGPCEDILKNNYSISKNDSLYILQVISKEEGMKIPKIEYEIYYPFNNLTKLDLSLCKGTQIEISIAVEINDTLDKYNASSDYYNNICYKTTSKSGTDISLNDRQNEFIDNNMSLCEENCKLVDYDYNKGKSVCSCDIKISMPEDYDIKFNKNDFLKSFIDMKNIMNLNVLKCYKTVFLFKSLIKNLGFFIISFILLLYFITLICFVFKSYRKLKKIIDKTFLTLNNANETKKVIKDTKQERIINKLSKNTKEKK